ncbi:DUF5667 domain-containing protein [Nocardioides sp. zg-DK7169]|uniref:DUF5667 domain-containing protein n=1 Tax=Nocardioides sp. zg-DK7169 TaxID=2736600 RepID=UPI001554918C|nr:DUF5667 domain-containing protein [Nocardioides sp. zg-DK7169]NPC98573.1 hypothetical protein [Nocardioides sp. zg-DK7169]
MSPVFAARRRAEEFDALVQRGPDPARRAPEDARYAELLELAGALRAVPAPTPRPEFSASLRERLLAEAVTELAATDDARPSVEERLTVPARRTARERRIAIAVGGFAVVGATTSMAVASQSALPGDMLYPIKRAIENAHSGVSVGDRQKGSTLLGNASARLREAEQLAREDPERQDDEAIRDTLGDFGRQAEEASTLLLGEYTRNGDRGAADALQSFLTTSHASLEGLSDRVSEDSRDALVGAGNVLIGIDLKLQQVCPDCPETLSQIPQWLITQASSSAGGTRPPEDAAPPPGDGAGTASDGRGRGPRGGQGLDDVPFSPVLPTDVPGGLPGTAPSPEPTPGAGDGSGGSGGSGGKGSGKGSGKDREKGPVGNLIEGLTGGEDNPVPIVPELLAGVGELLDAVTSPLLGGLTGQDRNGQ